MKYNPAIHHRRSIRLKNYDYSQVGAYFVTICVQGRECLLGEIVDVAINLSQYGVIVEQIWSHITQHFPSVSLDAAVVMPNHFHGIIVLCDVDVPSDLSSLNTGSQSKLTNPTLGQVVAYFKYQSTKQINALLDMAGVKFWQRNYYEHIIRSEASLSRLRSYIAQNPEKWQIDQLHPHNPSKW